MNFEHIELTIWSVEVDLLALLGNEFHIVVGSLVLLVKVAILKVIHYALLHQILSLLNLCLRTASILVFVIFLKLEDLEIGA